MDKRVTLFPIFATAFGHISPKWQEVVRYNVAVLWLTAIANIAIIALFVAVTVIATRLALDTSLWSKDGAFGYMLSVPFIAAGLAVLSFWFTRDLVKLVRYLMSGRKQSWT